MMNEPASKTFSLNSNDIYCLANTRTVFIAINMNLDTVKLQESLTLRRKLMNSK